MVGIVNYGSGNVHAISNIYRRLNIPHLISRKSEELRSSTRLILPGVGAFDETMGELRRSGLKELLDELVLELKKPIMGICVGMQLLSEGSEEGLLEGFGWVKGIVRKFDTSKLIEKPHLPHLGWNSVAFDSSENIFKNVNPQRGFYFLHSYYFDCSDERNIIGKTDYGISYASAVKNENVYGMQFHPEKSHQNGVSVFSNFSQL